MEQSYLRYSTFPNVMSKKVPPLDMAIIASIWISDEELAKIPRPKIIRKGNFKPVEIIIHTDIGKLFSSAITVINPETKFNQ